MKTGTGFVFQNITAERNEELLKMCIQMAAALKAQGDAPFAALLADENGDVRMEQDTLVYKNGDNTAHAESVLASRASQKFSEEFLWKCSLYTSCEPCCMCTGAIYWANIGRIVFPVTEKAVLDVSAESGHPDFPIFHLGCREVLARGQKEIVVDGPYDCFVEVALDMHR